MGIIKAAMALRSLPISRRTKLFWTSEATRPVILSVYLIIGSTVDSKPGDLLH